ncbi:hypothetical protein QAD02_018376 [Eretmocerus hayati]|uniref:Uncharacterized protein n=1 Tax=Eretmocerus hayati TaxID=131215 RepID=A0ACC2PG69_9HYME|nr:hypothetical protein QAD02_018376 [Eretmocerus hayati]
MNYVRQPPTEECPLTKTKPEWSVSDCFGFRSIICSFATLTIVITAALVLQIIYDDNAFEGRLDIHGAVASDNTNCSQLGTRILRKGGNAVDAAIAATLCMTVVAPHKTSLGSGGYLMVYSHKDKEKPILIDFLSNTVTDEFEKFNIRIPALLRGVENAHAKYGKLSWQEVVMPSVILALKGFEVSRDFAYEATKNINSGIFEHINAGEILTLADLANTLEMVSSHGSDELYNGTITEKLFNKTVSEKLLSELANYEPIISEASNFSMSQYAIFYPPSSKYVRPIVESINKLNIPKENVSSIESEIEVAQNLIKVARETNGAYINFTEIRRYTGVSAVDWQDTYVSIITGLSSPLNLSFGNEAGFVFDTIQNKDSLSSLTPVVFYDETAPCGMRGVLSADDPVVIGEIMFNLLIRTMNVSAAIEYPRYYILSDGFTIESDSKQLGNKLLYDSLVEIEPHSKTDFVMLMKSVNIIIKRKNLISGHSDSRGDGLASRFR